MDALKFGKLFEEYLLLRAGVSQNTLKFYRSDLNLFFKWFLPRIKALGFFTENIEDALPYLTRNEAENYKVYLEENHIPIRTINRRLSTLRQLSRFLLEQKLISSSFMEGTTNSGVKTDVVKNPEADLASKFAAYLQTQQISHITIKNYLSDIKHFIGWLENKKVSGLNNMTIELIQNYTADIIKGGGVATAKRRLSSLKKFFGWTFENGLVNRNPFSNNISKMQYQSQNRLKYIFRVTNIIKFGLIGIFVILCLFLLPKLNRSLNPRIIVNKTFFNNNEVVTNKTNGIAKIFVGTDEVTIRNPKITDYTIININPISEDINQVLFVKTRGLGFFKVGLKQSSNVDVTFNWQISDVK